MKATEKLAHFALQVSLILTPALFAQDPLAPAREIIPGHVEAENAVSRGGDTVINATTRYEAGQGQTIHARSDNSRLSYAAAVAEQGIYDIKIRYSLATDNLPTVKLTRNNETGVIAQTQLARTPSVDYYKTAIIEDVPLGAGDQTLNLFFDGGSSGYGENLRVNWFYFEQKRNPQGTNHKIYVVSNAQSGGEGSQDSPYNSLQQAFDRVLSIKGEDPNHGLIEILLGSGYHFVSQTIGLGSSHAGSASGPIRVAPLTTKETIVGGGRQIPPSSLSLVTDQATLNRFKPSARGQIYRANLSGGDWANRFRGQVLSWNGNYQRLAQYPNKSTIEVRNLNKSAQTFRLEGSYSPSAWNLEMSRGDADVFLRGHIDRGPEFMVEKTIKTLSSNGTISMNEPSPFIGSDYLPRVRVVNLLYELDQAGEWFYDFNAEQFYIWPIDSVTSEPDIRVASSYELIGSNSGTKFLSFERLTFQDVGRDSSHCIRLQGGDSNQIVGNTFRSIDARVTARIFGTNCKVNSNDFHHCKNSM